MNARFSPGPTLLDLVQIAWSAAARGGPDGAVDVAPLPHPYDRAAGCLVTVIGSDGRVRAVASEVEGVVKPLTSALVRCAARVRPALDGVCTVRVDVVRDVVPVVSMTALDPLRFGTLVDDGRRRTALPPDLPGVHSPALAIDVARRLGGLSSARLRLYRFTGEGYVANGVTPSAWGIRSRPGR